MDLKEVPRGEFQRHPWEISRAQFFTGELRRAGLLEGPRRFLDVGSGDAWFAQGIAGVAAQAQIVCWDIGYGNALPPVRERITFTAVRPSGRFDVLLMLDVAEHVADDSAFLRELLGSATDGAHVLFSVPAWPALYSLHDEALGHHRRYTPAAGRRLLESSGLQILRSGGLFHSLLPPRYMQLAGERRRRLRSTATPVTSEPVGLAWNRGRVLKGAVQAVLDADNVLSRVAASAGAELPGLSWWALCRRP